MNDSSCKQSIQALSEANFGAMNGFLDDLYFEASEYNESFGSTPQDIANYLNAKSTQDQIDFKDYINGSQGIIVGSHPQDPPH